VSSYKIIEFWVQRGVR